MVVYFLGRSYLVFNSEYSALLMSTKVINHSPESLPFSFLYSREQKRWKTPVQTIGVVVDRVWSGVFCIHPQYDWELA